jgi:hypothetical protein
VRLLGPSCGSQACPSGESVSGMPSGGGGRGTCLEDALLVMALQDICALMTEVTVRFDVRRRCRTTTTWMAMPRTAR